MVLRRIAKMPAVSELEALLAGLNPEQLEAVLHHLGPLRVGAVAGAGKTKSIVHRVAHLNRVHLVRLARILVMTFSKKAADEMNARLFQLIPDADARMGTFHSVARQFLIEEFPDRRIGQDGGWTVDKDGGRFRTVVKEVLGFRGMDWKGADITVVLQYIGLCKARCAPADTDAAEALAKAFHEKSPCMQRTPELLYQAYSMAENLRRQRLLITFDDMLLEMWQRLGTNEESRARWAARWDFVIQDEAQDENHVQRRIAELLAQDHRNYSAVGDPAQSIYGFRGSDPSGLLSFMEKWKAPRDAQGNPIGPEPKSIEMHRNYRCGSRIITAANGVLAAMDKATKLDMTITPERGTEGDVQGRVYVDADEEAGGVVQQIMQLHADGLPYKDIVVLYRTNSQSRGVEEELLSNRIPYVVVGGTNFYERMEVKALLAYLRLAAGRGKLEDVKRCINTPFQYLGAAFLQELEMAAGNGERGNFGRVRRPNERDQTDWTLVVRGVAQGQRHATKASAMKWCALVDSLGRDITTVRANRARNNQAPIYPEHRPAALLERIIQETEYTQWLTRDEGSESPENNRVSNVRELVRAAERFPTVDELLDYVEETLAAARKAKTDSGEGNKVTLMSIHRSKGLEWKAVFIIGCNEKILPHGRAEDMGEEQRLFYVACTRARDLLVVTCVERAAVGTKVIRLDPSRFLTDAGILMQGYLPHDAAAVEVRA